MTPRLVQPAPRSEHEQSMAVVMDLEAEAAALTGRPAERLRQQAQDLVTATTEALGWGRAIRGERAWHTSILVGPSPIHLCWVWPRPGVVGSVAARGHWIAETPIQVEQLWPPDSMVFDYYEMELRLMGVVATWPSWEDLLSRLTAGTLPTDVRWDQVPRGAWRARLPTGDQWEHAFMAGRTEPPLSDHEEHPWGLSGWGSEAVFNDRYPDSGLVGPWGVRIGCGIPATGGVPCPSKRWSASKRGRIYCRPVFEMVAP